MIRVDSVTEHIINVLDNEATYCRVCGYLKGDTKKQRLESFCIGEDEDPGFNIFPITD